MSYDDFLKSQEMTNDDDYISHHGVLGMKWGIRKYQNYDGSYTQRGLNRLKYAENKRQEAKENYKNAKNKFKEAVKNGSPEEKQQAYKDKKKAKRDSIVSAINEAAAKRKLERDYKADKGRELVQQGKSITGNRMKGVAASMGLSAMNVAAQYAISRYGIGANSVFVNGPLKGVTGQQLASYAATGASILAGLGYGIKLDQENARIRSYYAHKG